MDSESQERLDKYAADASQADIEKIDAELGGMNRGAIIKVWEHVQKLWAMINDPQAAWTSKVIAIGALIYLISPLDAVPDVIPVLGLTDDAGVILAAVRTLYSDLAKYKT